MKGGHRYAANFCRAARLISTEPFSATMIVGAFVLIEVTAGITPPRPPREKRLGGKSEAPK
jgi:hypothetical protein